MKTENKSKEFFTRAAMTLLVMIICPLGMSAQEILTDGDWNFKVTAGVATLVGYRGSATVITTPATVGGYTVRAIGGYCFTNNPISITVSEGVMEIDDRAFESCSNLTNVSLPTTLTSLGAYAFCNCSSLSAINLPSGLTHIYEYTFYGCSSLGSITIPSTVTVIGTGAFSGCSSLSSVSIPAGMIQIESSAFSGCSSLSSITIPAGVTLIENSTFLNCSSLSSVTILGNVTSIEKQAFYGCSNLKSISVPASLYKIGNYAFSDSGLADFWFNGTVAQWNNVDVDANAFYRTSTVIHYYCMVTYDMQGHGTAPSSQQVWSNVADVVTKPTEPTAQGYKFIGWTIYTWCWWEIDFSDPIDKDITLHALWTALENTITFDLDGRGAAISNQTVTSGNTVMEPLVQFDGTDGIEGWYTDAGRTLKYDFTTVVDHSMTLYAKWAAAGTATITTNGEGGTATLTNDKGQTFADGLVMPGNYTLTVTPDDGYSFSGSYTLTNRSNSTSDMPYAIIGSAVKTYALDLTEKDAAISVTFSSNPILTVTTRADDASVLNEVTWSVVNNENTSTSYDNGNAIPVVTGGAVSTDFGIRLDVGLGSLSGYAFTATITDMGSGTTVYKNSNDGTSFLIQPYGSIDIDLYVYEIPTIALQDDTDNSTTLAENVGIAAGSITLQGRTFYKDGDWNTLCLPFAVSSFAGTPLENATVMSLKTSKSGGSGFNAETGVLTLNFTAATSITAGKAYIVKWENAGEDITDPVFTNVTISSTEPTASTSNDKKVTFKGTFSPVGLTPNDKSNLFLGAANTLYYPNSANNADGNYYVNACRAYFTVDLATASLARKFVLNFDGEDEATGITDPTPDPSPAWEGSGCAWHSLDGRRLSGKPAVRGIYINNGRKIVIK